MAVTKSDPEPSMEEILASIRRIISEEGGDEPAADSVGEAKVNGEDVFELTDVVVDGAGGPAAPSSATAAPEAAPEPQDDPADEPAAAAPTVVESFERLVTGVAAVQTSSQFTSLARAAAPDPLKGLRGGRPVEDICIDLLKPMLKEWLDANLPGIVERIVEREIRYLSRRTETE
ncbi:MAG: DUF2497 domain-containing protein [Alphaproteobacteria bacterium]